MNQEVLEALKEVLTESAVNTASMLPFLFLIFLLVEALSHSSKIRWVTRLTRHVYLGPLAAAVLGLLPQCGFSVLATAMYLEHLIPVGSLIAAYVATSDEAIPVLASDLGTVKWIVPLLATKLVFGACAGIAINLGLSAARRTNPSVRESEDQSPSREDDETYGETEECPDQCIGHEASPLRITSHALSRTTRIAAMVFVIATILNLAGHFMEGKFLSLLKASGPLQVLAVSIVGLIPTCATSVALAEGFATGLLSFPSLLSGLISNSGMGLALLIKESRDKRDVLSVILLLVVTAFLGGLLASLLF